MVVELLLVVEGVVVVVVVVVVFVVVAAAVLIILAIEGVTFGVIGLAAMAVVAVTFPSESTSNNLVRFFLLACSAASILLLVLW